MIIMHSDILDQRWVASFHDSCAVSKELVHPLRVTVIVPGVYSARLRARSHRWRDQAQRRRHCRSQILHLWPSRGCIGRRDRMSMIVPITTIRLVVSEQEPGIG